MRGTGIVGGFNYILGRREKERGHCLGALFLCVWLGFCGASSSVSWPAAAHAKPVDALGVAAARSFNEILLTPLVIKTSTGSHHFQVEVAATPEAQTLGLMHRKSLAPDRGMLFELNSSRKISMWMKNTLIPLDIMFVNAQGRILKISADAVPGSLTSIRSDTSVRMVLEVLAGTAARIGAVPGDQVRYRNVGTRPNITPIPKR